MAAGSMGSAPTPGWKVPHWVPALVLIPLSAGTIRILTAGRSGDLEQKQEDRNDSHCLNHRDPYCGAHQVCEVDGSVSL